MASDLENVDYASLLAQNRQPMAAEKRAKLKKWRNQLKLAKCCLAKISAY